MAQGGPKEQGLAGDTRAFCMRPLGAFEATYGAMRKPGARAKRKRDGS